MYYLLFFVYLLMFCFFAYRVSFIKNSGLSAFYITCLFLLKVISGVALGWISQHYFSNANDYWSNNAEGLVEYHILVTDPINFFTNITQSNYQDYGNYFGSVHSYWNDLEVNLLVKLVALTDIFSQGNYYINSIFFSFFGFLGHVAFFRVFRHAFKSNRWAIIAGSFLIPTTLYFTAGVHKDAVLFMLMGIFTYCLYFTLVERYTAARTLWLVLSFIGILLLRNYTAFFLLPCSLALILCFRIRIQPWKIFSLVYLSCILALSLIQSFSRTLRPLDIIVKKQADFAELGIAGSQLSTVKLEPTIPSFIHYFPHAINHSFFRPYILEFTDAFSFVPAIELMVWLIVVLLATTLFLGRRFTPTHLSIFALTLGVTSIILIGYIVPNSGSIVRYRSLFLPLIITPAIVIIAKSREYIKK